MLQKRRGLLRYAAASWSLLRRLNRRADIPTSTQGKKYRHEPESEGSFHWLHRSFLLPGE
jgi:hypothetical protein